MGRRKYKLTCNINCNTNIMPIPVLVGMSYTPFQQWNEKLFESDTAFMEGTVFTELHKPFGSADTKEKFGNEQKSLKEQKKNEIYALQFVLWDLHLYMDTHPNDTNAFRKKKKLLLEFNDKSYEYRNEFGPIYVSAKQVSRWAWISEPWPWEQEDSLCSCMKKD